MKSDKYAIVLVVGETLHAQLFPEGGRKNKLSCGSFIFLNLRPNLSPPLLSQARSALLQFVLPVRISVERIDIHMELPMST